MKTITYNLKFLTALKFKFLYSLTAREHSHLFIAIVAPGLSPFLFWLVLQVSLSFGPKNVTKSTLEIHDSPTTLLQAIAISRRWPFQLGGQRTMGSPQIELNQISHSVLPDRRRSGYTIISFFLFLFRGAERLHFFNLYFSSPIDFFAYFYFTSSFLPLTSPGPPRLALLPAVPG